MKPLWEWNFVQMALWPWAIHCGNSSRVWDEARTVGALVNAEHTKLSSQQQQTHTHPWSKNSTHTHTHTHHLWSHSYACKHTYCPLTFAIGFEISVHRWGLALTKQRPAGRGLRAWAKSHVGRWRNLFSQGWELHSTWGHGDVVGFVHWLWQTARVMMWRWVGTHGHVVLVDLFCRMATHWHHSFAFLRVTRENRLTYTFPPKATEWLSSSYTWNTHKIGVEAFIEVKRAAFVRREWSRNVIAVLGSKVYKKQNHDYNAVYKQPLYTESSKWCALYIISLLSGPFMLQDNSHITVVLYCVLSVFMTLQI